MIVRGVAWILTTMPSMPLIDSDSFILLTMWACWRLQDRSPGLSPEVSQGTRRERGAAQVDSIIFNKIHGRIWKNRGALHEQVIIRRPWM